MLVITRADFKSLCDARLADAEALLQKRRYGGAYYLCGYVVECALKACVARAVRRYQFPPNRSFIEQVYSHDLAKLAKAAELEKELEAEKKNEPQFELFWSIVVGWSEQSRYEQHSRTEAEALYQAITDVNHGVLQWIRRFW